METELFEIERNGEVAILKRFLGDETVKTVKVPDGITAIGEGAFYGRKNLSEIILPDSVTVIGNGAFKWCGNLAKIGIPSGVVFIGKDAFCGCGNLYRIELPARITSIGAWTFKGCDSLTSITIPEKVTSVGEGAFCGCSSLAEIELSASVTSIGDYAFQWCTGLTEIRIPAGVIIIGGQAFEGCGELTISCEAKEKPLGWNKEWNPNNRPVIWGAAVRGVGGKKRKEPKTSTKTLSKERAVTIDDYDKKLFDIEKDGKTVTLKKFLGDSTIQKVEIPYGVTAIGKEAFKDCYSLTSITIPASVTSIGDEAFYGCSSLISITIPSSITSIGDWAFEWCYKLIEICDDSKLPIVAGEDNCGEVAYYAKNVYSSKKGSSKLTTRGDYIFYENSAKGKYFLVSYTGGQKEISLPSIGHKYGINSGAFCNSSITKITIPSSVTSIGDGAFQDCNNLASITIPSSVTSIGNRAFYDCSCLTSIVIPSSVTSIGSGAFGDCNNLASITIPSSVTSIGDSAFEDCSSLTSITIPSSVTSIGAYAFDDCRSLTSITIPSSVTSIGKWAFQRCGSLTSITIPSSVTTIDYWAFRGCSNLAKITIPTSVTSIGESVFSGCGGLTIYCKAKEKPAGWYSNWNPDNRPIIWGAAIYDYDKKLFDIEKDGKTVTLKKFLGDSTVKFVEIPYGITSIGDEAFKDCSSLTSITIPASVTSIGNWAFQRCSSLTSITIPPSITTIDSGAFWYCSSLMSITIPASVTSIGNYAFWNCSSLTSITIPSSVTSIGFEAFYGCGGLVKITIPASVTSIGYEAFKDCKKVKIYCEAKKKPRDWDKHWKPFFTRAVWGVAAARSAGKGSHKKRGSKAGGYTTTPRSHATVKMFAILIPILALIIGQTIQHVIYSASQKIWLISQIFGDIPMPFLIISTVCCALCTALICVNSWLLADEDCIPGSLSLNLASSALFAIIPCFAGCIGIIAFPIISIVLACNIYLDYEEKFAKVFSIVVPILLYIIGQVVQYYLYLTSGRNIWILSNIFGEIPILFVGISSVCCALCTALICVNSWLLADNDSIAGSLSFNLASSALFAIIPCFAGCIGIIAFPIISIVLACNIYLDYEEKFAKVFSIVVPILLYIIGQAVQYYLYLTSGHSIWILSNIFGEIPILFVGISSVCCALCTALICVNSWLLADEDCVPGSLSLNLASSALFAIIPCFAGCIGIIAFPIISIVLAYNIYDDYEDEFTEVFSIVFPILLYIIGQAVQYYLYVMPNSRILLSGFLKQIPLNMQIISTVAGAIAVGLICYNERENLEYDVGHAWALFIIPSICLGVLPCIFGIPCAIVLGIITYLLSESDEEYIAVAPTVVSFVVGQILLYWGYIEKGNVFALSGLVEMSGATNFNMVVFLELTTVFACAATGIASYLGWYFVDDDEIGHTYFLLVPFNLLILVVPTISAILLLVAMIALFCAKDICKIRTLIIIFMSITIAISGIIGIVDTAVKTRRHTTSLDADGGMVDTTEALVRYERNMPLSEVLVKYGYDIDGYFSE